MKQKVLLITGGGSQAGFKVAQESLLSVMKSWGIELEVLENPGVGDVMMYADLTAKYRDGYKIVSVYKAFNETCSTIAGTNVIDTTNPKEGDVFYTTYLNKKPLKLSYPSDGIDFEFQPMFHPLFTIESDNQMYVYRYVETIRNYCNVKPVDSLKTCSYARNYKELYDWLIPRVPSSKFTVSYDVETNFEMVYSEKLKIVGFSLSFGNNEGVYVVLDALESRFSDVDKEKATKLLAWLFDKADKVVGHNIVLFDTPATYNFFGYELAQEKLEDTMVWSKMLNCGRKGGNGLKALSVYRLGYSDWSDVKDEYQGAYGAIIEHARKVKQSNLSKMSKGKSSDSWEHQAVYNEFSTLYTDNDGKPGALKKHLDTMKKVLGHYYDSSESTRMLSLALSTLRDLVDGDKQDVHQYSYELLPSKIVGDYGALDSIACYELLQWFQRNAQEEDRVHNINTEKGYRLWMESHYAGYNLERDSLHWDREQSEVDESVYKDMIATDVRTLLTADKVCMKNFIQDKLKPRAIESYFETNQEEIKRVIESRGNFAGYTGTGRIRYTAEDGKVKNIVPTKYDDIIKIFGLSTNKIAYHHKVMVQEFIEEGVHSMSYDELREFLNPNTDEGKRVILDLIFNEYLLGAKFILEAYNYATSESYNIDKVGGRVSQDEMKLLDLIATKYSKNNKPDQMREVYSEVMEMLSTIQLGRVTSRIITSAGSYKPSTVDEVNMTEVYELQCVTGVSVDRDMHNGDEFSYLFAIRRMKKVMKLLDTYMNGNKLGRGTLYVVDKNVLASGVDIVPRKRVYEGEKLAENETLISQAKWNPNGVLSGRWSGALHTLPSASDTKRWYDSRFRGGCITISDYCLTGDTRIPLLDGSEPTIAELVGRDEFYVYSYDEEEKKIKVGRGHSARVIRRSYKNLKITLDNGATIECTPEHRFFDYNLEIMREAQEYKIGDSLLPIRFSTQSGYRAILHPFSNNKERTYYLGDKYNIDNNIYDEEDSCDIHHIDKDRDDDSPTNLERVPSRDHKRAHRIMNWEDEDYRSNMSESAKKQWETNRDEMLGYATLGGKAWATDFNSRSDAGLLKSEGLKSSIQFNLIKSISIAQSNGIKVSRLNWDEFIKDQELDKKGYMLRSIYGQYQSFKNFLDVMNESNYISNQFYEECLFLDNLYEKAIKINQSKVALIHRTKLIYEAIEGARLELNKENWDLIKDTVGLGKYQKPSWESVMEFFENISNINRAFKRNHRIVNIEEIEYFDGIDTYCLTVDGYHNFFLSAGVLSSNSQAEVRVVAKAANDTNLLNAYEQGIDVHLKTACSIFNRTPETISETERRFSKMGCHLGSTLIKISENESIPIEEMYARRDTHRFETLSYDIRNRVPIITEPCNIQLTSYVTELTKLTFSNGGSWIGTPDHPFLTRSGLYVRADLCKGQKMISLGEKIIEVIEVDTYSCEPTPVYDLSIPEYHNYLIDLGYSTGVFVHNTFNILYGGTPNGFASSFLNGDIETANKIFRGFFETYPDIKVWMDARHKEIQDKGVVTLMTNRYVKLGFEGPQRPLDKIIRQSGNVPKVDGHYHGDMVVNRFVNCWESVKPLCQL